MGGELHLARRGVGHERAMRRWCACKQRVVGIRSLVFAQFASYLYTNTAVFIHIADGPA